MPGPIHHPAIGQSPAEQSVGIDEDFPLLDHKKNGLLSIRQSPIGFDVPGCRKIAILML
ncbi:hypothetical protein B4102_3171 [Heyndrickxia sporothermodurans]|uniref:Uncharacterized protein n=1 Tax=Heyndrickxia sporothermodurans TaxID=46224 RepID=A0A150KZC9_9BACI|nr:hypothetical protein [Heyndrickxia sporothermodurans]KYD05447.1 hypothetical protein B4102_3171 [Heyndrickxia sporothermodurans]